MNAYQYAKTRFEGDLIAPYQTYGVRWMIQREHDVGGSRGGLLCDEMGLGKTAQTICTILADRHRTNTLILCPKSIVDQWAKEFVKFAPCFKGKVLVHEGVGRTRDPEELKKYRVVIASMGMIMPAKGCLDTELHRLHWHRVVIDEAHNMRNPKSKVFNCVWGLNVNIRWCLTGTPVFNDISDFLTLVQWVGVLKNHVKAEYHEIVSKYVLRRTKEEVGIHNEALVLPPCDVENVMIDLNEHEREIYGSAWLAVETALYRVHPNMIEILVKFLRCRQCLAYPDLASRAMHDTPWEHQSSKMDVLMARLEEHPTEKTLVFCNFRGEMNAIQERATRKVYRIDGSFSQQKRQEQIDGFSNDTQGAIFVIQIKAGGVGLNLQGATRVYITSPAWNPATEIQAIGRAHRTGQTQRVKVCRLIAEDPQEADVYSIEKGIIQLQEAKTGAFKGLMSNVGEMGKLPAVPGMSDMMTMFNLSKFEQ